MHGPSEIFAQRDKLKAASNSASCRHSRAAFASDFSPIQSNCFARSSPVASCVCSPFCNGGPWYGGVRLPPLSPRHHLVTEVGRLDLSFPGPVRSYWKGNRAGEDPPASGHPAGKSRELGWGGA